MFSLVLSTSGFMLAPAKNRDVRPSYVPWISKAPHVVPHFASERGCVRTRAPSGPRMGLFGLGGPEIAVICAVALLILGPEQVKKLAKDVGKVSAELKMVPEEFNKGLEVGALELEKKKQEAVTSTLDESRDKTA